MWWQRSTLLRRFLFGFPKNNITYAGGASTGGPVCTKLVANTIRFKGNSTFNTNCSSSGTGTINYTNGTLVM
jgi:hypothetical protein